MSEHKPIPDPPVTMELNELDAKLGNIFLKYLVSEFPDVSYPNRMRKMIQLYQQHYGGITTVEKAKMLILESMLRHVHSHGEKRFKKLQRELKNYMTGDNKLVAPVGTELKFIPAEWNDLWKHPTQLNLPDFEDSEE